MIEESGPVVVHANMRDSDPAEHELPANDNDSSMLLSIGSDVLLSSCDDGIVLPVCASDSSAVVPVDDGGVLPPGRVLSVINGSVMSVNNNSVLPADSCVLPACASDSSTVLPIDNGGVLHPRNVLSVNNCTVLPVDNCELPDHAGDSSIVLPIDGSSVVPTSSVLSVNEGRVTPVRYGAMLHVDNCEPTACAGSEGSVLPAVDGGVVPFGSLSPIVDEHVLPANVSNGTLAVNREPACINDSNIMLPSGVSNALCSAVVPACVNDSNVVLPTDVNNALYSAVDNSVDVLRDGLNVSVRTCESVTSADNVSQTMAVPSCGLEEALWPPVHALCLSFGSDLVAGVDDFGAGGRRSGVACLARLNPNELALIKSDMVPIYSCPSAVGGGVGGLGGPPVVLCNDGLGDMTQRGC